MTGEPDVPELAAPTLAVRHLISAAREFAARTSRELGVNGTDTAALSLLEINGPMGPTELATSLGLRSASVSVLLDRLERAGHVERVRSTTDRRRVLVATTPSAHRANLDSVLPSILAIDAISARLDERDRTVVLTYLDVVTAAMREATH